MKPTKRLNVVSTCRIICGHSVPTDTQTREVLGLRYRSSTVSTHQTDTVDCRSTWGTEARPDCLCLQQRLNDSLLHLLQPIKWALKLLSQRKLKKSVFGLFCKYSEEPRRMLIEKHVEKISFSEQSGLDLSRIFHGSGSSISPLPLIQPK